MTRCCIRSWINLKQMSQLLQYIRMTFSPLLQTKLKSIMSSISLTSVLGTEDLGRSYFRRNGNILFTRRSCAHPKENHHRAFNRRRSCTFRSSLLQNLMRGWNCLSNTMLFKFSAISCKHPELLICEHCNTPYDMVWGIIGLEIFLKAAYHRLFQIQIRQLVLRLGGQEVMNTRLGGATGILTYLIGKVRHMVYS